MSPKEAWASLKGEFSCIQMSAREVPAFKETKYSRHKKRWASGKSDLMKEVSQW